jgi:manganese/iron transport system ATP-binding protein
MLEVQQVSVNYASGQGLDPVSFQILPGEMVGVMGPNGAGKSTMMKAILGLVPVSSGHVHYCTCPLHQQLEKVAYVPQRSQIDWDYPITVETVVSLARTRHLGWFRRSSAAGQRAVRSAMERVNVWDLRDRRIGNLSGGQQQRVFLARALAQEAEMLLFDEPFTGVDATTEEILFRTFAELRNEGKILLISSHEWGSNLSKGLTTLDRLLLLNHELIASGTPQEVMTQENLRLAYGRVWTHAFHGDSQDDLFC